MVPSPLWLLIVGSNPALTTIVSVMATHRKLRYYARLVNKRYTERKESYRRIRCKSPRLNLLRLCKVKSNCSGGGTGRHVALKMLFPDGSAGSIPASSTKIKRQKSDLHG